MTDQNGLKKIFVITDSTRTTGLGRYSKTLSIALDAHLISLRKDKTNPADKFNGAVINGLFPPFQNGWYLNQFYPSIFMRRFKEYMSINVGPMDIVHYSSQTLTPLNNKCSKIITVHDLFAVNPKYNQNRVYRKAVERSLFKAKLFDHVLTVSDHVKTQLINEGFSGNIQTIYPSIDSVFRPLFDKGTIRKKLNLPLDKKLVLCVAKGEPRKNLGSLKPTLEILGKDYVLVQVGFDIGNGIRFKDVDDEKLNLIYNACDVLIFPSFDEGFGYPLVEAMSVGLPVVASDIEVFKETAGKAAILSEPSPAQLAKSVKEAINSRESLINEGFLVAKKYTFEEFKGKIKQYYKENIGLS